MGQPSSAAIAVASGLFHDLQLFGIEGPTILVRLRMTATEAFLLSSSR